jgi:HPt (histidine-containing phosphotransfer) domain-containing protein
MAAATFKYLKLEEALARIGDKELMHEMLLLLHLSIEKDWRDFEDHMAAHRYSEAGKLLHILKGSVPFFTGSEITETMQHVEKYLKKHNRDSADAVFVPELRTHVVGFIADLNRWVENTNTCG